MSTSVCEELNFFQGKILVVQGDADKNVFPESARVLYTSLLSKGKDILLEIIPNTDHSFNIINDTGINGWEIVANKCIEWFLQ